MLELLDKCNDPLGALTRYVRRAAADFLAALAPRAGILATVQAVQRLALEGLAGLGGRAHPAVVARRRPLGFEVVPIRDGAPSHEGEKIAVRDVCLRIGIC